MKSFFAGVPVNNFNVRRLLIVRVHELEHQRGQRAAGEAAIGLPGCR
jgi:hypothetical protein